MARLIAGRTRALLVALVVIVVVVGLAIVASRPTPAPVIRTEDEAITVPGGPGVTGTVTLDATLYLPADLPAPSVIMAHGFGGSKDSVAGDARDLAGHGFVVLAYSARGFGRSTGQIALDSLDYEIPDARALVDWLAKRTDVIQDGPNDPRVGVTGASYGGALSLMLAGTDRRIDAVAPLITWNNLSQALFPNALGGQPAGTPAATTGAADGVFKKAWAASLIASVTTGTGLTAGSGTTAPTDSGDSGFGRGQGGSTASAAPSSAGGSGTASTESGTASTGSGTASTGVIGCGRLMAELCAAYSQAAQTGRAGAGFAALLANSSPSKVVGNITAPTLLVQGERDTLFGLDQADANARAIAAKGTTVALTWYNGGHDGGSPDPVTRNRITGWFQHYLSRTGPVPATSFVYSVDGPIGDNGRARTRTLSVDGYPGLTGPATVRQQIALIGASQVVVNPPGGSPAGVSSLPGLSGLAGSALATLAGGIPGQVARFRSAPLDALTVLAGAPRVTVRVARIPSPSAPGGGVTTDNSAVLFASLSKVTATGVRTLAGSAVAPIRIADLPRDGSPITVSIDLPAAAFQIENGSRIEVGLSTTDQAYAGPTAPAVYQISLAGDNAVSVAEVGGVRISAGEIPTGSLIGLIILVVLFVLALTFGGRVVGGRTRKRPAKAVATVGSDVTPDPGLPLVIRGLRKSYPGGVAAVTDVSFRVERGQVLGLLGPNGAGKTTTLRMVMGLITPTAGDIEVFGQPIGPGAEILSRIGSFVEGSGFLPHLSGEANLQLYWRATGRPMADAHLAEALEIAGLGGAIRRRVKTYSQGMRQRLAIAQAMLGMPDLLLMDEPTNGLDPPQIHAMREVLRGYAATGRTVLVSSHLLSEVEQTCSHVVVVHQGRTIASGTVTELVSSSGDVVFGVDDPARAAAVLRSLTGVREVDPGEQAGTVRADLAGLPTSRAVAELVGAGIAVNSAAPRNRLEDVFLELVGASGPPTAAPVPPSAEPVPAAPGGRS